MNVKRYCILLIFTGIFTSIQAQIQREKRWRFGLRAGVNVSQITDVENDKVDYKVKPLVGYNFGIVSEYKLASNFYFTPSINISIKGTKLSAEIGRDSIPIITPIDTTYQITDPQKIKEERKLAYFEIPVQFAYRIRCAQKCNLDIMFGPYVAIGMYGKYNIEDTRYSGISQGRGDVFSKSMYSTRMDVGVIGGINLELWKHYRLGVNYAKGLTSLKDSFDSHDAKPKNSTWAFTIGYMF